MGICGIKLMQHHFAVSNMLFWRFATAALWLIPIMYLLRHRLPLRISTQSALNTLVFAAFLYSLASTTFFLSARSIGSGLAISIFFSFPVFVAIFCCLFNRWLPDRYTILSLIAICTGIVFIKDKYAVHTSYIGIFLAGLSAISYATYLYRSRVIINYVDPLYLTLLLCIGNTIIFFILAYSTGRFFMPATLQDWLYILALGIFATAIPNQLMLESLKYISPIKVAILASLEVVITMLIGWIFLHERITLLQMVGIGTILFGSLIIQASSRSLPSEQPDRQALHRDEWTEKQP